MVSQKEKKVLIWKSYAPTNLNFNPSDSIFLYLLNPTEFPYLARGIMLLTARNYTLVEDVSFVPFLTPFGPDFRTGVGSPGQKVLTL